VADNEGWVNPEAVSRLSAKLSAMKRQDRVVAKRRRRRRREYYDYEDDNEPEQDPNERMPGESYIDWWKRIGCKLHKEKPWTWF